MTPESIDRSKEEKRTLYTCPCGFSSYDLFEFLRHPFMEYTAGQEEKVSTKSKEEE